jgi:hypothetical protein
MEIEVGGNAEVIEVALFTIPSVATFALEPAAKSRLLQKRTGLVAGGVEIEPIRQHEIQDGRFAGRRSVFDPLPPRLAFLRIRPGEFETDERYGLVSREQLAFVVAGVCVAKAVALQGPFGRFARSRAIEARKASK